MEMKSGKVEMFARWHICSVLQPGEKCFRVQRFLQGRTDEVFHEHVPAHRISVDAEIETLKSFVEHFAGWPARFLLHSRLNNRPGGPSRYPGYRAHFEYPEEGVVRRYIGSGDTAAWCDYVILPASFRSKTKPSGKGRRAVSRRSK